ncbi:hypothetical protein ACI8AC_06750 [Geodermatophilus sp. SYSU D00758]
MSMPALTSVPVRSGLALTRRWVALLSPPVFGARSLWLTWFGTDDRQLPVVVPVDDLPERPEPPLLTGLLDLHTGVTADSPGGPCLLAMALCRPGDPAPTADDERWAAALREVLDGAVPWSLHLAAGGRVRPLVEAAHLPPLSGWAAGAP